MTEQLDWTEAGRAALAREQRVASLREAPEAALIEAIATTVQRYAPAWDRGHARADDVGRAAAAIACTLDPQRPLRVEEAAGVLSLLGARSDGDVRAYTELLLRREGWTHVLRVLTAMWSLATDYHDPDWPRHEQRLAIWAKEMAADSSSAQDASVSHAKGDVARYLYARLRDADEAERTAAREALAAVWPDAPLHSRAALAYAVDDAERAAEIARDLLAGKAPSHPHFGWRVLPFVVRDVALLMQLPENDLPLSTSFLAVHGGDAIALYERRIARGPGTLRERFLQQLLDLRGPRTAALMATYADKKQHKKTVAAYFARFPELAAPHGIAAPATAKPRAKAASATKRRTRSK